MATEPIRIIVVDDHKLARESLSLLLGSDTRFSVVRQCADGHDAIQQGRLLCPDIMLVDINMDPVNGFEVAKNVLETNPEIKIIGISINNTAQYAHRMLTIGARGFVTKGSSLDEVTYAIMEVHNGRTYVSSDLRGTLPDGTV
jgi:DNA-binding NarL/FixJ family response regulator